MLHAQDLAGEHGVPELHQLNIAAVVTPDILKAVGEFLTGGEELLEVGEAAGEGLAARVDDLGIRQDEMDEADVPEIVGHLVDETRLAHAVHPGLSKVLLAHALEVRRIQVTEHAGVARTRVGRFPALQLLGQARNLGQLRRAFHLRVRGQNLLEERRACPGQANNENGLGACAPDPAARAEELRRAHGCLQTRIALGGF